MKNALRFAIATAAVVLVAGGASAQKGEQIAKVQIDFEFMAAAKTMPAGTYLFEASGPSVIIRPAAGSGASTTLPIATRLGRPEAGATNSLVFDMVKGERLLSEIWPAGAKDGYCVLATSGEHTHQIVGWSK
jgi:hypothetical protein